MLVPPLPIWLQGGVLAALFLLVSHLVSIALALYRHPAAALPSPPPRNALVGHLGLWEQDQVHEFLREQGFRLSREPLWSFRIYQRYFVVVNDPALIRDVLQRRPDEFDRSPAASQVMKRFGFPGLVSELGSGQDTTRAALHAAFASLPRQLVSDVANHVAARLVGKWNEQIGMLSGLVLHTVRAFDVYPDLIAAAFDAQAMLTWSSDASGDADVLALVSELFQLTSERVSFPYPRRQWRQLALERRVRMLNVPIDRGLRALVRERIHLRAQGVTSQDGYESDDEDGDLSIDLLDAMLDAHEAHVRSSDGLGSTMMHDQEALESAMVALLKSLLFTGHDSTANSLAWTLVALAQHPELQARVQAEVDSVFDALVAQDPSCIAPELPPHMLSHLRFTEACLMEASRLFPVIPMTPVTSRCSVVVRDVTFPAGTVFVANHTAVYHSDAYYYLPNSFVPQRWLDTDHEIGLDQRHSMFWPFGEAGRVCPARHAARVLLLTQLAYIARAFTWRLPAIEDPPRQVCHVTMGPKHGVSMRLSCRSRASGSAPPSPRQMRD